MRHCRKLVSQRGRDFMYDRFAPSRVCIRPPLCLHNRNVNFTLGTSVLMKPGTSATDAKKRTVPRRSLARKYDYETRARGTYVHRRAREENRRTRALTNCKFHLHFAICISPRRGRIKVPKLYAQSLLPRGGFSSICRRAVSVRSLLINSQLCVCVCACKCSLQMRCNASV